MAFGGIFAVVLSRKMRLLNILYNPITFYVSLIASVLFSFVIKNFTIHHYDLYSVLFGIIILNLASNPKFSNVLENRVVNYLGTISYGMYMYHPIIIFLSIKVALSFGSVSIIYLLSFIGTIFISHLSFKYFEGYFLRRRISRNY
jgi:peptidoglycan/LPS O-acetylase OafA/YrhL